MACGRAGIGQNADVPFRNFHIWRGRLPHWRADDVTYYVTFRHRRELDEVERQLLLRELVRVHERKLELHIACVLPETTEMLFRVKEGLDLELADVVEGAKRRAGKAILKRTEERFPPFYTESYDRIVRDEIEYEERWSAILESPVKAELVDDPEHYTALFVAAAM